MMPDDGASKAGTPKTASRCASAAEGGYVGPPRRRQPGARAARTAPVDFGGLPQHHRAVDTGAAACLKVFLR